MADVSNVSDIAGSEPRALGYSAPTIRHEFQHLSDSNGGLDAAQLAAEVPVALVYNARPHAVMMCTPADLEDFAYGFTVSEQIAPADEIARVEVVRYARGIELQLEISEKAAHQLEQRGRAMMGRTGCGLCGVEVIETAMRETPPVQSSLTVPRE